MGVVFCVFEIICRRNSGMIFSVFLPMAQEPVEESYFFVFLHIFPAGKRVERPMKD